MDEKLEKYFFSKPSDEEKRDLFEELDKNEILRKEFAKAQNILSFINMGRKEGDEEYSKRSFEAFKRKRLRTTVKRISLQISKYAAVVLLVSGLWFLYQIYTGPSQDIEYTHVEVSAGQKVKLILSDGTEIWLGSRSKMKIPDRFIGDTRMVELDGEALFTVSKDEERPFIVKTKDYNVKVLGTKFNVFSYSSNSSFETLLLEGSVCVYNKDNETDKLYLSPNQKVVLKNNELKKIENFTENGLYLENGIYSFEDVTLQEILGRLEIWYDVEFDITNTTLSMSTLSGKFRKEDSVKDILIALQKAAPFRFNPVSDRKIEIY